MVTRSFIRWAGSKKKLIPQLLRYWASVTAERYVEPFAGSATLFFSLEPQKCLLADMNNDLINMYIAVQKNYSTVYQKIKTFELGQQAYYAIRAQDVTKLSKIERAARFIYLNRFCFNGLYRTNKKGIFNVPYALGTKSTLPSEEEFIEFSTAIKNVTFVSQDFRETLKNVEKRDFVYIDPPYAVENHRIFKSRCKEYGTFDAVCI